MKESGTANTYLPGLRGAAIFYALCFALSWAIWGTLILFPQTADWSPLIIIFGAYGPLIAALILSRLAPGPRTARSWLRSVSGARRQWRWLIFAALILPLLIALAHLGIFRLLIGPISLSIDPPWYWAASTAPLNILVLFWMSSAIEEFGWQGFAMPRLTASLHPLLASLIHGLIWATWHLPLYFTGVWKGDNQEIWLLYAITITLTPTMFWLTQKAAGSVIPAVLFHAATNHYSALFASPQEFPIFIQPLAAYFTEIKVAIYLLLALFLILITRGRLGQSPNNKPMAEPVEAEPVERRACRSRACRSINQYKPRRDTPSWRLLP